MRDTFLMNTRSGLEALKCALTPKNRQQEGIPFNKVWLGVANPSTHPFKWSTSY